MTNPVLIGGAGPAGLALAIGLAKAGLEVVLIEPQDKHRLAEPVFDGREIALTHSSIAALRRLGAWDKIPAENVFPLVEARVLNGKSSLALSFDAGSANSRQLGSLVSNCDIRRALFATASEQRNIRLLDDVRIEAVRTNPHQAQVTLSDGSEHCGSLLVAADSRFSSIRGLLGISARMNRLGKSMLVGRVKIEEDHGGIATEWFDNGQTLALLPLAPKQASAVVTLPDGEATRLAALDTVALGQELTRRFDRRFGAMRAITSLHCYPLTTTYAHRFMAERAALIGDAAVGMHPVTAHGFNLGLAGTERLVRLVRSGIAKTGDPGHPIVLKRFQAGHRSATWPLYAATNAIVGLYTDDRLPGRIVRQLGIRTARLAPARKAVSRMLMQGA
ncbi:5-demethoxyubiquinol-8 5-hydroxylase UbiM [Qipengyuania gaetbuli]|uniref:5-demethoxyubiquinol-8 5-hydroxylase UbiM n=1 Tax=Qipengyuania gaetbuli TaxID=266952 RepID=UPI001CFD7007|nr:5-demethoxyubiquinol-8 5-hydroxylase UbiM [Qipengyuania gaetbuli]